MSNAMNSPVEAGKPARPVSVLIAALLMGLMALVGVISAIAGFIASATVIDEFRVRALGKGVLVSDVDDFANVFRGTLIVAAVLTLLFSVLLAVLAIGVLRGNNPSRIATWVVCALGVLCGCCGLCGAFSSSFSSDNVTVNGGDNTSQLLTEALLEALPGWYSGLTGGSAALQTLGYIAVAALLALPAANAFFRKRPQTWQPPVAGTMQPPPPYPNA